MNFACVNGYITSNGSYSLNLGISRDGSEFQLRRIVMSLGFRQNRPTTDTLTFLILFGKVKLFLKMQVVFIYPLILFLYLVSQS